MSMISLGDLAKTYMLRRQNTDLKTDLQRLTAELTTGQANDIGRQVGGDYAQLAGIDAALARLSTLCLARNHVFGGKIWPRPGRIWRHNGSIFCSGARV